MKKATPRSPAKAPAPRPQHSVRGAPPPMDRKWEAREALHTLTRAEEIKSNSGLMRDVKAEAQRQMQATQKVIGASSAAKGKTK